MAKKKYEEQDGVWRTVGGRRIFIRNGQDLSSAMKESGKFKSKDDYIKRHRDLEDAKNRVNIQYDKDIEDARMTGNDKLEESAKKARTEQLRDIDRMQKENRKEYDAYKGTKYERQYDSVEDRYNRDKDFRDRLKDIDKKYNDDKLMSKEEYESYASRLSDRDDYARTSYQDYIDETKNVGSIKKVNDSIRNYDGYKKNDKDYYGSQFVEGANTENKYKTGDRVIYNGQEVEIMKTNRDPRYGNEYLVRSDEGNVWVDDHILKPAKENPYIKTLEKHNLNDGDSEFKRVMLGRMESDINYYLGNGSGYAGHLWAKDEEEQINIMKALYNTLPEKEKPDWINEEKIEEYSKMMQKLKSSDLKTRFKSTYEYMKNNTTMSELEILEYLKKYKDKKNI